MMVPDNLRYLMTKVSCFIDIGGKVLTHEVVKITKKDKQVNSNKESYFELLIVIYVNRLRYRENKLNSIVLYYTIC